MEPATGLSLWELLPLEGAWGRSSLLLPFLILGPGAGEGCGLEEERE